MLLFTDIAIQMFKNKHFGILQSDFGKNGKWFTVCSSYRTFCLGFDSLLKNCIFGMNDCTLRRILDDYIDTNIRTAIESSITEERTVIFGKKLKKNLSFQHFLKFEIIISWNNLKIIIVFFFFAAIFLL